MSNLALQHFLGRHQLPESYLSMAESAFSPLIDEFNTQYQVNQKTYIIGINGCQGSGKSTLADYLCTVVAEKYHLATVALSLDDFYLTKAERIELARKIHPLLAQRGVPGTHDVNLAIDTISSLASGNKALITRFDKSMDDRVPEANSETITGHIGLIVIEGWCFGAKPQAPNSLIEPVNHLERLEDPDGVYRDYVNTALATQYPQLFELVDSTAMLRAPSFKTVFQWRLEQEQKLIEKLRSTKTDPASVSTMSDQEIRRFIQNFQRITEHCLEEMPTRVDHLFQLNAARQIVDYRKPQE
jgi:D-glycerate 3-kinase